MARINLLPWRQEERLRKNKEFNVLAGAAAAFAILLVLLAMTFLNNELSNQQAANDKIKAENARLDGVLTEIADLEKQRDDMLARMKVIQDLQGRRSIPVRVWDDIARAIPNSAYLVSVKRERDLITLTGFASGNDVVAEFIRNLDASAWLGGSIVPNIKTSVQAYAPPAALTQNNKPGQTQRAVLPEDSYISFTIATKVISEGLTSDMAGGDPANNLAVNAPAGASNTQVVEPAGQLADPNVSAQPVQGQTAPAPQDAAGAPQAQPAGQPAPAGAPNAQPAQPTTQPAPAQGQANTQPVGGQ